MNWTEFVIPLGGALAGFLVSWGGLRVVVGFLKTEIDRLRAATDAATEVSTRLDERLKSFERELGVTRAELNRMRDELRAMQLDAARGAGRMVAQVGVG